ncbi:MAG TPA: hypothetical protein VGG10_00205 [Rhizomicrobium sp.]
MTSTTNWRDAVTGDFAKAHKWDDGKPGIKSDAVIAATGADYVVKVIGADAAHILTLDSADATLNEKGQGSLHAGRLAIESGTAILTTTNAIGSIAMTGGELKFSNAAALGDAAISIGQTAKLSAIASAEIANNIVIDGQATFTVGHGQTLAMDGAFTFDPSSANRLNFLSNGHGSGPGGVIDVNDTGSVGAVAAHCFLTIDGVTLGSSVAGSSFFNTFVSSAQSVVIDSGALDLTNQNDISLARLFGDGDVVNTGGRENLVLSDPQFGGTLEGDFNIRLEGGSLAATAALKAGDTIHVIGGGDIGANFVGDAPAIELKASHGNGILSLEGSTFNAAPPAVDMGTGQNNELRLDHTFNGTISDFGGHNGGTDVIVIGDEDSTSDWSLQYDPNASGTGGELVVQSGMGPIVVTLNLEGSYSQGDFVLNARSLFLEIDCSSEQSSPHTPEITHIVDALI